MIEGDTNLLFYLFNLMKNLIKRMKFGVNEQSSVRRLPRLILVVRIEIWSSEMIRGPLKNFGLIAAIVLYEDEKKY